MNTCAYCGRRLPLFHRVVGSLRFCSREHIKLYFTDPAHLTRDDGAFAAAADRAGLCGSASEAAPDLPGAGFPEFELPWMAPAQRLEAGEGTHGEQPASSVAAWIGEAEGEPGDLLRPAPGEADSSSTEPPELPVWLGHWDDLEAEPPAAAQLLPLEDPRPQEGPSIPPRSYPARAPRRRILAPSHRPARRPRQPGGPGCLSLHPGPLRLRVRIASSASPLPPVLSPDTLPFLRASADSDSSSSGLCPPPAAPLLRALAEPAPVAPSAFPAAVQAPRPEPFPDEACAAVLPAAASARPGLPPSFRGKAAFPPLPLRVLPPGRQVSCSGLIDGTLQPFRLFRPVARSLRLGSLATAALRPSPVLSALIRPALFESLAVPRVLLLPARPGYAFGPRPGVSPPHSIAHSRG